MFSDVPTPKESIQSIPALFTVSLLAKGVLRDPRHMAAASVVLDGQQVTVVAIVQGSKVALFKVTGHGDGEWILEPFGVLGEAVSGV